MKRLTTFLLVGLGIIFGFFQELTVFGYREDGLFSYKETIVHDYQKDFFLQGYQPWKANQSVDPTTINPDYPSVFLYVQESDLPYLLDVRQKDKQINVYGYESNVTVPGNVLWDQNLFFSSITLRGVTSLTCTKPSFRLPDAKLKLKSMCGADFGMEELLFSRLLYDTTDFSQFDRVSGFAFYEPHDLYNLFINDQFYGVYIRVPNLGKKFLTHNGLDNVKPENACIFKITNLITHHNNPYNAPILTTLHVLDDFSYQDLDMVAAIRYGDKHCYEKLNRLLLYIQGDSLGTIDEKLIDRESILGRGLLNWLSQMLLSYEHNYLLVFHKGRYYMGFWDNEGFRGCLNTNWREYWNQPHQNLLFSQVLRWYEKNDPDTIDVMMTNLVHQFCNADVYTDVLNSDGPFVFFDRFLRNIGHFSVLDYEGRSLAHLLKDIYYGTISFASYKEKMFSAFERYFVLGDSLL